MGVQRRGDVVGELDVQLGGQVGTRMQLAELADDRVRVALVNDLVERDVPQPPRGLGRLLRQPFPVVLGVGVRSAVRLRPAEHQVVQAAQVDRPRAADLEAEAGGGISEPAPVAVPGGRVPTERVVLRRQHRQVLHGEARLLAGFLKLVA
jgi:hypothetical protein